MRYGPVALTFKIICCCIRAFVIQLVSKFMQWEMKQIMKIVVLNGGISTERDVSLVSGTQIYKALKSKGHDVILLDVYLGYEKDLAPGEEDALFTAGIDWAEKSAKVKETAPDIEAVKASRRLKSDELFGENVIRICRAADIVFMGLHGDFGENGKIQAALDLYGIKYTGTDYLSSALAMDKTVTKALFKVNGVPTPESYILTGPDDAYVPKFPSVVKVSSGGSSIGVFIVHDEKEYREAVKECYRFEGLVLVEQYIKGREFTDCVFDGRPLPVVEIIPKQGFYDYKNKYEAGATVEICPAEIPDELTKRIQKVALDAYNALRIKTYARMDILMNEDGELFCLESNTLPGMTPTSLITQEARAEVTEFPELCEKIIEVSLKKY